MFIVNELAQDRLLCFCVFFLGGGGDNRGLSLKQWFKRGRVGGRIEYHYK